MIFFAFVLLAVILVVVCCFLCRHHANEPLLGACVVFIVLTALVPIVMGIGMICTYIEVDGFVESANARYESLIYQYENDFYENGNGLAKKQLVSEIQKWNEDLAYRKAVQRNFWTGIFYPNVYDQFSFIELG